jgi:3-hydroxyisobutyrate dehydrogenase-like beta-hydroxyacid dehydrogenase
MKSAIRICLLGFGEVGQTLGVDLRSRASELRAWDLKFADATSMPSRAAPRLEVIAASDARAGVAEVDLIISAVTAAQIAEAAQSVARYFKSGAFYFDLNSTSPSAKQQAAAIVEGAGGRFVEAAIMSPIAPKRSASPMLLGGPHAAAFLPLARELGFLGAEVFSGKLGAASAAKMCRSVVIKGLEALLLESLVAARHHGVEQVVLESLQGLVLDNWRDSSRYMISRALLHGRRRAEEMREVVRTVQEAGLTPRMSGACAEWQDWAAQHAAAANADLDNMLDVLVAAQAKVGAR